MRKKLLILLCILGNITIVVVAGKLYREIMDFVQYLMYLCSNVNCIYIYNLGSGGKLLVPTYLFLIIPISVFFRKKIKQIGIKKYWFFNFILQCIVIVLCQIYKGFQGTDCKDEVRNFSMISYNYFILPWNLFFVIFLTFSIITFGIYYNQLLWDKILLNKK